MAEPSRAAIAIPALTQVGIVVKDVEKIAQNYWNILGIGPWTIITLSPPNIYDRTYHGKPAYYVLKVALAQVGPVELELMQTVEGHTICDDLLAEHGEGASHVQYLLDSAEEVERHVAIMAKKGFPAIMTGRFGNNGAFAYLDTVSALKTIWEPGKIADEFYGPTIKYPADDLEISPAKVKVKAITQVSFAIKNLAETMENYWNLVGVGPWDIIEAAPPLLKYPTYHGKPTNHAMKGAFAMAGPVEIELHQPVWGDTVYTDFICEHGEGINHLGFQVDDVDEITRIMEAEGFPTMQSGAYANSAYAYYDTIGPLKILWEAFRPPPTTLPFHGRYP